MAEYVDEGWHPRKLAFLNSTGLIFSVTSSLDCQFLSIVVGFDPANSLFDASAIGAGLWSFQSPAQPEECLIYSVAQKTKMVLQDSSYESAMLNSDVYWSIARVAALMSAIFGLFGSIIMWSYVITGTKTPSKRLMLIFTIFAITFEGLKILFFFRNNLCTVSQWQLPDQMIEESMQGDVMPSFSTFRKASACMFNRGSFFSMASLSFYMATMTFVCVYVYHCYQFDSEFKEAFKNQRRLTNTTGLTTAPGFKSSGSRSNFTLSSIRNSRVEEMAVLKPSEPSDPSLPPIRPDLSVQRSLRSERSFKINQPRSERPSMNQFRSERPRLGQFRSERPPSIRHQKSERQFQTHHPRSDPHLSRAKSQRFVQKNRSERHPQRPRSSENLLRR